MTDQRPPKKSEVFEVRIPYPTKLAFMEKAKAEGRVASEIVRESIDRYIEGEAAELPAESLPDKAMSFLRSNSRNLGMMLAGAGSAVAIMLAAAPANAGPGRDTGAVTAGIGINATSPSNPLMIMVDVPAGGLTATELGELVGRAIARLDKDGNGVLMPGER